MTDPRMDIRDAIIPGLTAGLQDVLQGAAADLQTYILAISDDLARVIERGDAEAMTDELLAQLRAVGEIQRIRVTNAGWSVFRSVIHAIVATGVAALTAGILRLGDIEE